MGSRLRRLSSEIAKFTAVNGLATLVALIIFNLVVHGVRGAFAGPLHDRPLTSYFMANCVGMWVSYQGSRRWAFRHREAQGRGGGAVNYVIINVVSFVIPITCLWFSRNVLHLSDAVSDNLSGNVVGSVLGSVFRFWMFRTFVFTAVRTADLAEPSSEDERVAGGSGAPEVGPSEAQLGEQQP